MSSLSKLYLAFLHDFPFFLKKGRWHESEYGTFLLLSLFCALSSASVRFFMLSVLSTITMLQLLSQSFGINPGQNKPNCLFFNIFIFMLLKVVTQWQLLKIQHIHMASPFFLFCITFFLDASTQAISTIRSWHIKHATCLLAHGMMVRWTSYSKCHTLILTKLSDLDTIWFVLKDFQILIPSYIHMCLCQLCCGYIMALKWILLCAEKLMGSGAKWLTDWLFYMLRADNCSREWGG